MERTQLSRVGPCRFVSDPMRHPLNLAQKLGRGCRAFGESCQHFRRP
jgi:hypothetical protein